MGLLTESDIAAMLNLDTVTIQGWRTRKKGPPYTKLGKSVFYHIADIEEWIANNKIKPKAAA